MTFRSAIILLLVCLSFSGYAQNNPLQKHLQQSFVEAPPTFPEMQRAYEEWKRNNDLTKSKDWKFFERWQDHQLRRAKGDGNLHDPAAYSQGAQTFMAHKAQAASKRSASSSWLPVGPSTLPGTTHFNYPSGIGRINCITFHPTDPSTFWVGVAHGGVWKTTNDGASWTPIADDLPMLKVNDIAINPADPDTMYVAIGDFCYMGVGYATSLIDKVRPTHYGLGVYMTTDGGTSWQPTGLTYEVTDFEYSLIIKVMVHPTRRNEVIAIGSTGIFKSTDAGTTWSTVNDSLMWDLEMDPTNPEILYAASGWVPWIDEGSTAILKSTDFGDTWNVLSTGLPAKDSVSRIDLAISLSDPSVIYGVAVDESGNYYGCIRTTDAGATWSLQSTSPEILGTDNGMTAIGAATCVVTIGVHPDNPDTVYIGGVNYWASYDGGVTWDGLSHWTNAYGGDIHGDQQQLKYNPLSQKFYSCHDGGISVTSDMIRGSWTDAIAQGSSYVWPTDWTDLGSGLQTGAYYRLGLSANNPGYIIAGAQDQSTQVYNNSTWELFFGGDGMDGFIDHNNTDVFWGTSQFGALHRCNNGGSSQNFFLNSGIGESGQWITPYAIHPDTDSSKVLYAGFGNVYRSTNSGGAWTKISNFADVSGLGQPTSITQLALTKDNPAYIYAAKRPHNAFGAAGSIVVTKDYGTTWTDVTGTLPDSLYPTYIYADHNNADHVWVSYGGFDDGLKVFKSTDAGATWTNISDNLPNLPVNCIVHNTADPNNGIYAATDLGVYFRDDLSTEWSIFSWDLPNVIITEIEIHPMTQNMYASTFGRGIWKVNLLDAAGVQGTASQDVMQMTVLPNPTSGVMLLQVENLDLKQEAQLKVLNMMGQVVHHLPLNLAQSSTSIPLKLDLLPGVYFMTLEDGARVRSVRFVVE
jgi:photosystem II stability/assembly factor-like uncharacterized protein